MNELEKLNLKIKRCKKCNLWKFRKNAVPGEGPIDAKIFFVGQNPGRNEDLKGKPFVGLSGEFLDKMLNIANIERKKVFITGAVKCHTPKNRKPTKEEIEKCKHYLLKQIEIINPKIVVILGEVALDALLSSKEKISKLHGKLIKKDKNYYFITFHPAAGMRFPKIREMMIKDFKKLGKLLKLKSVK